ncbi:protein MAINTENANCE OF MERISTEMS-like [Solanum pennellii]|uniref:Protein MAINTENANCE OF MERISTEMS-like n=1 Tax=Solanum pennellii TaxID=28526 RepID=A0ABM1HEB1_SOLPN|nr:protein MAINTENANCE OF MERISTEMS-like [Solanum pennellii]
MAANNAYQLDSGPLDPSLLTGQLTHRSRDIWTGNDNMILTTRECDGKSHRPVIDRSLITALVERWRPETHTFHFRMGESTITLPDVEILYGLPVKGNPIVGYEPQRHIWWSFKAYVFAYAGGYHYSRVGSYSWGSATLAYLYRFLCKASQSSQNEIAGFLPLLQRVTVLRPQIVAKRDTRNIFPVGLPRGPHAARWYAHFSWTDTTKHVLRIFRDALDSMTEDQVGYIHLMVNKAISLGENPSMEEFY